MPPKPTRKELTQRIHVLENTMRHLENRVQDLQSKEDQFKRLAHDYATILDNIPAYIYFKDTQNNILRISESVARITGLKKSDIEGRHSTEIYPDTAGQYWADDLEVIKSGKPKTGIIEPLPVTTGETRWLLTDKIPVFNRKDQAAGIVVICTDITERIQAENRLKESEERLVLAQNGGKVGIWELDFETNQALFSEEFARIHGIDKSMAKLDSMMTWAPPEDHAAIKDAIKKANVPGGEYLVEHRIIRQDTGEIRWVSARGKITPGRKDGISRMHGTTQDITKQKIAEQERDKLLAHIHHLERMESIGNLAGGIAHDFNNILASILGFAELALDDIGKNPPVEDSLQEIFTAGKRAKELVKQILAFARQSGEEKIPLQVARIAREVLKLIRSTTPSTIDIRHNIDSESLIMGNAIQVNQLFMNLCTNAAQAMEKDGGVLDISIKDIRIDNVQDPSSEDLTPGDYIEIKISDTGIGIPTDAIYSIFDPYFTTKPLGQGTGMGLALVHGIVKSYNGKINVASKTGKGSLFTIHLPVTHEIEIDLDRDDKTLPGGSERILLVDDEASVARAEGQILMRLGYSVTIKKSSRESLELFRSNPDAFDLCISDMTMPEMTGDRLAVELIKIRPGFPVILCTGYSNKISEEKAIQLGIKAFAYKPVIKADLAKTVRQVLDNSKANS